MSSVAPGRGALRLLAAANVACVSQPGKQKKKFSSFFKSLVIELDKDLYGPDNHLVEVSGNATEATC